MSWWLPTGLQLGPFFLLSQLLLSSGVLLHQLILAAKQKRSKTMAATATNEHELDTSVAKRKYKGSKCLVWSQRNKNTHKNNNNNNNNNTFPPPSSTDKGYISDANQGLS
jgi:aromatic ring-opening dioxygenase catalytic subunit (LigB family)